MKEFVPNLKIKRISSSILVRRVGNKIIRIDKYTIILIYIDGIIDRRPYTASLIAKIYIVDNLKAKLLIGNDIIIPKGIIIDLNRKVIKLGRY